MKHLIGITMLVICSIGTLYSASIALNSDQDGFETILASETATELEISLRTITLKPVDNGVIPELSEYFKIGSGIMPGPQQTVLPTYSTLLAIPEDATLSVEILNDEFQSFSNITLGRADEDDLEWLPQVTASSDLYPENLVRIEYSGKMRDLHLAQLTIYPVQYDYSSKTLNVHHNLRVRVNHDGGEPFGFLPFN